jgi:phage tail protein X
MQYDRADSFAWRIFGDTMTTAKLHASTILTALGDVQSELLGKAVVLTDGKAGTVEGIWLDELHGLRISIRGHDGKWPISTIKIQQGAESHGAPL